MLQKSRKAQYAGIAVFAENKRILLFFRYKMFLYPYCRRNTIVIHFLQQFPKIGRRNITIQSAVRDCAYVDSPIPVSIPMTSA